MPIPWPPIIAAAGQIGAEFAGRDRGQGPSRGATATTQQFQLGPESDRERILAMLAERLGLFGGEVAMGGGPISLDDLIAGRIGESARNRFDQLVFGDAFKRAIGEAERTARESASARGLGGGSGETQLYSRLVQPTLESAAQARIGLEMSEVERLNQLRQNLIANALAFQDMPALNRLTALRLATGTQRGFQATQPVGEFTPYWRQTQFVDPNAVGLDAFNLPPGQGQVSGPPSLTPTWPTKPPAGGYPPRGPWFS